MGQVTSDPGQDDGPTAHTAALTSDYFAAASRRLGDALASYLDHEPPAGLVSRFPNNPSERPGS